MSVCVVANVPCKPVVVSVSCLSTQQLQRQTIKLSIPERVENVDRHGRGREGGGRRAGDKQNNNSKQANKICTNTVFVDAQKKIFLSRFFQFEPRHSCSEIYLMVLMQR